jgi:hypothetical protein
MQFAMVIVHSAPPSLPALCFRFVLSSCAYMCPPPAAPLTCCVAQEADGFKIDGQMNFDSGWEWGYWLNDVITARAAWVSSCCLGAQCNLS